MPKTLTVLGTCHHDCPDSCGWVVTVEDGRATKMRGNPEHPYSQGELCPKVNRFLERVYAEDRILHPLIRAGAKGSGEFRRASWDEALRLVGTKLREVIATYGGEAVMPWNDAGTQGLIQMSSLDRRFFAALGATRPSGSVCGATARAGLASTYGSGRSADPLDIRHAEVILIWGCNIRLTNRHLWPYVEEARANGAQVVVIDPVRTMTAESADWALQPLPGTDVALMLAVMHVLVRDGLVDLDYVDAHAAGFDDLVARVAEWTPARAAAECGVAAADIERLAALYGSTKRSYIRTMIGPEHYENGAMFFRTIACLPVLTGAWTVQGGGLSRSVGSYNDLHLDDSVFNPVVAPTTREINMSHLGRALTDPEVGIHALFVWAGNPVVSIPNAGEIRRGLAREDLFTVVSEQFMTDTAAYADVIFPATTQIEQLDVVGSWGSFYTGWNEPAIEPLGESVPDTELWRRLAAEMGIDDPLFALDDEALIRLAVHGVDVDVLRKQGFARYDLPEVFLPYAEGGFATADGKALLRNDGLTSIGQDALPDYVSPYDAEGRGAHPLTLLSPKTHPRFLNSSYSHHHARFEGGPYVEVDPADAAALGLADGTPARVWNDRGSLELPVRISTRLRPGVVAVPWGWWGEGANINALTNDDLTHWGGGVAYNNTTVSVSAA